MGIHKFGLDVLSIGGLAPNTPVGIAFNVDPLKAYPARARLLTSQGIVYNSWDGSFTLVITPQGAGIFTWKGGGNLPVGNHTLSIPIVDDVVEMAGTQDQTVLLTSIKDALAPAAPVILNYNLTIAAGGTGQFISAQKTTRKGYNIQNQSTGALRVRQGETLCTSTSGIVLPPGAFYTPEQVSSSSISVWGATTGQAFYFEEW